MKKFTFFVLAIVAMFVAMPVFAQDRNNEDEVVKVEKGDRNGTEVEFKMIDRCPMCNSELQKIDDGAHHYCLNPNCDARNIESIIHYVSYFKPTFEPFQQNQRTYT